MAEAIIAKMVNSTEKTDLTDADERLDEGVGEGFGEPVDEGVGEEGATAVHWQFETLLQSVMRLLSKSLQIPNKQEKSK